jgi:predicted metal-dependent hydrolase
MKRKINLSGKEVVYHIRKYKMSKNLRLSIRPCFENESGCEINNDLKISISAPWRVGDNLIEKFIKERSAWILEKMEEFRKDKSNNIFGDKKSSYKKEKERSRKMISARVNYFGKLYGFRFSRIAIRSQRTRWGSCSKEGNLNFNYKLIYLPQEIMDYVIVHELCHLDQFNHSKQFWFLVSEIIPDYKELRKKLKKLNM